MYNQHGVIIRGESWNKGGTKVLPWDNFFVFSCFMLGQTKDLISYNKEISHLRINLRPGLGAYCAHHGEEIKICLNNLLHSNLMHCTQYRNKCRLCSLKASCTNQFCPRKQALQYTKGRDTGPVFPRPNQTDPCVTAVDHLFVVPQPIPGQQLMALSGRLLAKSEVNWSQSWRTAPRYHGSYTRLPLSWK